MFNVNKDIVSAFKQYLIMPSASLFYHSPTPVSTSITLHNLANCIVLPIHVDLVRRPGTYIQNVQSWDRGTSISFLDSLIYF
jgi:hypothetical protein